MLRRHRHQQLGRDQPSTLPPRQCHRRRPNPRFPRCRLLQRRRLLQRHRRPRRCCHRPQDWGRGQRKRGRWLSHTCCRPPTAEPAPSLPSWRHHVPARSLASPLLSRAGARMCMRSSHMQCICICIYMHMCITGGACQRVRPSIYICRSCAHRPARVGLCEHVRPDVRPVAFRYEHVLVRCVPRRPPRLAEPPPAASEWVQTLQYLWWRPTHLLFV